MILKLPAVAGTVFAAFLLVGLSGPAAAGEIDDLKRQVEALTQALAAVQDRLEKISAQQTGASAPTAPSSQAAAAPATLPAAQDEETGARVSTKGGIKVETVDGAFSAQIFGRLQTDAAWYREDKSNLGGGTEIRRVRLGLKGTLFNIWDYKTQFDFAGNTLTVKDAYLRYTGFSPVNLTVGNFKEPFSLEDTTSSKYTTFMERGLPNAFVPGRGIGIGADTNGRNWSLAMGVYGDDIAGDPDAEGDERWDVAGRASWAPLATKTRVLHLGGGLRYHMPNGDTVQYLSRPESHVTDARFVDTGSLGFVDDTLTSGLELAGIWGPYSLQGEYMRADVRRDRLTDLDFSGWYAMASYFLTGESRPYNPKKGVFGRLKPKHSLDDGGIGAWEIAARRSVLDLDDEDVLGGQERNWSVALNWYPNAYVRVMSNYILVDNNNSATGNILNLHGGESSAGDDDPQIFQVRLQVDY